MNSKNTNNLCPDHQLEFFYFCESCSQYFCQDCAVFNPIHQSHNIFHLSSLFTNDLTELLRHYGQLGQHLYTLHQLRNLIDLKQSELYENYHKESKSLNSIVQSMQDRLDEVQEKEAKKLTVRKKILQNEKTILEKILKTIQTEVQYSTQWQMIKNSQMLLKKIQEITAVPWEDYEMPLSQKFVSELTPSFKSQSFVIQQFSSRFESFDSPVLQTNVNQWRLKVYPKGNGGSSGEFISVFLSLIKGVKKEAYYDFFIEIINSTPALTVSKECSLKFKQGECWGFSKFLAIDCLDEGFLENDSVSLAFGVRPITYKQMTEDQSEFISEVKVANKIMKKILGSDNK